MNSRQEDIGVRLKEGCFHIGLNLDDDVVQALRLYVEELQRWNRKINLVAKKTSTLQIVEIHFLDSLALLPHLKESDCTLLDVGTGAGFPGLVCGTAQRGLSVTLVEPRQKRVSFLRHIVRTLALDNIEVIGERIENINTENIACNCITSRAVTGIADFLEMVDRFMDSEMEIICMKGPKWHDELEIASPYLTKNGIGLNRVEEFTLPFSRAKRALLFFKRDRIS